MLVYTKDLGGWGPKGSNNSRRGSAQWPKVVRTLPKFLLAQMIKVALGKNYNMSIGKLFSIMYDVY